ncbi:hypothetical protein D043_4597B, partial [Vibrio parahaemolyticus EKP-021]
IGK